MYVCMYVVQLARVCSWRLATSGTFGSEFECGRAAYINSLGQGTNIQLPLSSECQILSAASIYSKCEVHHRLLIVTSDTVVLDCRIVITVSNLGLRGSCMYVCTNKKMSKSVCVCACVRVCVCACVRACVRVCVFSRNNSHSKVVQVIIHVLHVITRKIGETNSLALTTITILMHHCAGALNKQQTKLHFETN